MNFYCSKFQNYLRRRFDSLVEAYSCSVFTATISIGPTHRSFTNRFIALLVAHQLL